MPLVFISYSSDDRQKVERLAKTLQAEKDIEIWMDTERILPGDDIVEEMKEGIRNADNVLICLSPSFDSRPPTSWVKKELKMAILKENRNLSVNSDDTENLLIKGDNLKSWAQEHMQICRQGGGGKRIYRD